MKRHITFISYLLLALSSAIFITFMMQPLFVFHLQNRDTLSLLGLTHDEVIENYNVLLLYLLNPFQHVLDMPTLKNSAQGLFHFHEVKQLFLINNTVLLISGFLSLYGFKTVKENSYFYQLFRSVLVVPVVVILVLSMNFQYWFVLFHKVFFQNDAWVFNPASDPIILVLSESFFLSCFVLAFSIMMAWLIAGYLYYKRAYLAVKKSFPK